jgi:GNAT superfamily N-acetyltransferase
LRILEVGNDPFRRNEFLKLPVRIYRNNPYWIRPLNEDIENVFDPDKNKLFKNGECSRWLVVDHSDQTVGRVAAFINHKTVHEGNDQPTGGMGFFECANDLKVARLLFDTCRDWLAARGMEAMDGPINFGERDSRWGLLVEGYDKEPTYGMDYHMPYYRTLFEEYGFRNYIEQYTYYLPMREEVVRPLLHPAVFGRAEKIYATPGYDFRHVRKSELEKFAEDFREIYNKAWAKNLNTSDMTVEQSRALMQRMKPILEEELMWFGYYEEKPVAFFIMLPELNQIFKHVNGKLDWIGKLKFLYHKLRKTNHRAFGVIFGVIPEFQKKGIESAIAMAYSKVAWRPGYQYTDLELNWIGDFNPKMMNFAKMLGGVIIKKHITYRYLFDPTKEFKRHPVL